MNVSTLTAGRIAGVRSTTSCESREVQVDDRRQRELPARLQGDDEVIAAIGDADSILFFGPGEAKGELQSRPGERRPGGCIATVETVDTDRQIAEKVRA